MEGWRKTLREHLNAALQAGSDLHSLALGDDAYRRACAHRLSVELAEQLPHYVNTINPGVDVVTIAEAFGILVHSVYDHLNIACLAPTVADRLACGDGDLFVTNTIAPLDMEGWVLAVAALSGQHVGWYHSLNGNVIYTIGNIVAVKEAIAELMPEHDRLWCAAVQELGGFETYSPPRPEWWPT